MASLMCGEIEDLVDGDNKGLLYTWDPPQYVDPPDTPAILDLVRFVARHVAYPTQGLWHDFFHHHHLALDRKKGLRKFVDDINRLFSRNGLAYKLNDAGVIERIVPAPMEELIRRAHFSTGDQELDRLLDTAIDLSLQPQDDARQDALEKLWAAFERLKSIESPGNKKEGAELLINRAVACESPVFHAAVTKEFLELTHIGNKMRIRHSAVGSEPVGTNGEKDYLFWRMLSLIWFMLKVTGRISNAEIITDAPF